MVFKFTQKERKKERKKERYKMQQNRKKIYEDKFKEILSKRDYPKNTIIKLKISTFAHKKSLISYI